MIPLLLSVLLGAGFYLLYDGLTAARPAAPRERRLRAVEELLLRAGLRGVTGREFVLFSAAAGLLVGACAQLLLGWALVSLSAAALGVLAPFLYYAQRAERRRSRLQVALVDAIAQLRSAIRTGLSVQEALVGLARTGPEVLRPELAQLAREARLSGFEPALEALRERMSDPLVDTLVMTLALNDRLGGRNVGPVLDRLAEATRAQLRVQEEARAQQARHVASARVVAAVPLVVLVLVRQIQPAYLAVYDTLFGQLLLAGCVGCIALGYAAMRWTARLPGERRVLR